MSLRRNHIHTSCLWSYILFSHFLYQFNCVSLYRTLTCTFTRCTFVSNLWHSIRQCMEYDVVTFYRHKISIVAGSLMRAKRHFLAMGRVLPVLEVGTTAVNNVSERGALMTGSNLKDSYSADEQGRVVLSFAWREESSDSDATYNVQGNAVQQTAGKSREAVSNRRHFLGSLHAKLQSTPRQPALMHTGSPCII